VNTGTDKNPKRRREKLKGTSTILFLFAGAFLLGAIGWLLIPSEVLTERNTTEFNATFSHTYPDSFNEIITKEHEVGFVTAFTSGRENAIITEAFTTLETGSPITFRIRNADIQRMANARGLIQIVALTIEDVEIITLDSTNRNARDISREASFGFAAAGGAFLFAAIACRLIHINKKKTNTSQTILISS